jgi:hypothetical protein
MQYVINSSRLSRFFPYQYRSCASSFCYLAHFAFARSPETNTTRTAAYAAVAAKIASRFALVVTLRPSEKKTIKVMTSAKRALGFVTKYKTTIGQASRNAAIVVLKEVTTHETRWFSKCRNLSHSCGDRRYRWSAKQLNSPQKISSYLGRKWPMITQKPRQEIFLDRRPESHKISLDTEHVPITIVKL